MMIRFEEGITGVTERLEQIADSLDSRMSRIERDLSHGEQERRTILSELAEARVTAGEVRDIANALKLQVEKTGDHQVAQAARGAAEGAATVAAQVVSKSNPIGSQRWRWGISALAGIAAFGALVDNLPKIIRFVNAVWTAIAGVGK